MSGIQIDTSKLVPALQTAYSYLAEGNWRNANDCFDLELKQSPLDPYACLGKAMTANCLKTPEELNFCTDAILDDPFFSAALKYAEEPLKNELTQLVVRLNYDRQKAAAPQAAIETAADRAEAAEFAVMVEPEMTEPAGKTNWDIDAYAAKDASAAAEPAAEKAEETLDVVPAKKKSRKKLVAVLVIVFVLLLGAGAAAAWFYLIPLSKYNKAVDLINNKQFDDGLAILEELGDFSDAPEQHKTGLYVKALNLLANNEFDASKEILEELGDFKDAQELIGTIAVRRVSLEVKTIAAAAVGDVVSFGTYETDGNTENGEEELRWVVLQNRDDLVTLITEQSIAAMRYHFNANETSWADCSLRSWLNGTFYTSAFSLDETGFICKNYISTPANPDYPSPLGEATVDKVYLLSLSEALSYFRTTSDRKLTCTPASYQQTYTDQNDFCCWWLRTPGAQLKSAVGVDTTGQVMSVGYDCYKNEQIGVRPVIVVDISGVTSGASSNAPAETSTETETTTGAEPESTTFAFRNVTEPSTAAGETTTAVPESTTFAFRNVTEPDTTAGGTTTAP